MCGKITKFCQHSHVCVWPALVGIAVVLSALALAEGSLHSSTFLHNEILQSGLRAPMQFFDSTPIGRILNRFSKDVDVVDSQLPRSLHSWIACALSVVSTLFVICFSTPMFLVVVLPMGVVYYLVQVFPTAISCHLACIVIFLVLKALLFHRLVLICLPKLT